MEAAFYIAVAALLFIGPVVGFVFGVKCCAGWFGIDLHPGDTMQVLGWDEMPEVYRPHFFAPEPETRIPTPEPPPVPPVKPQDSGADVQAPADTVRPDDAVDAMLTAVTASSVLLAQLKQDVAELAAMAEHAVRKPAGNAPADAMPEKVEHTKEAAADELLKLETGVQADWKKAIKIWNEGDGLEK